jgi:predicted lipoprotein with Yx(FWY)xxD motif
MNKFRVLGLTAIVLASALAIAACGGSSYSSTTAPTNAPTSTQPPAATGTPAATSTPAPVATTAPAAPTVSATTNATLNETILVDSAGVTLYTFANDTPGTSACNGGCASNWPPLAASGAPTAGTGVTGTLGTITRSDGTMQVTYNGMPLYGWQADQKPGDVTGNGVNNFHVAVP